MLVGETFSLLSVHAQGDQEIDIEQSSEVFLEEYSDTFQENFFEGLKQKGIRNYDRAINYFLECKRLQPQNTVVSFELAKFHLYDNQLSLAQEYALEAINGEPENYWYAETLSNVIEAQKIVLNEVTNDLPWNDPLLRRNMSEIYFLKGDYQTALNILKGIKKPKDYAYLQNRILDSIAKTEVKNKIVAVSNTIEQSEDFTSVEHFKNNLKMLLANKSTTDDFLKLSVEALDNFPNQPYFYYANGAALNRRQKHNDAIDVLEAALDFLIDDVPLENSIYKELVDAYNAIDQPTKANTYLNKIKPGY